MRTRVRHALAALSMLLLASPQSFAPPLSEDVSNSSGFTQALAPREFSFPRDHGPHPDFRHEWWYVTGNLDSPGGERFGFELTFFRFALAPPASSDSAQAKAASHWRTRQIYMAHFAVSDVSRNRFTATERYARDALDLAGAQPSPFKVRLEDWSISERGALWQLHAAKEDYSLTLDLQPLTPPIPNGERGLSRKSSALGSASYYYSIPRVAVQGTLVRDGQPLKVSGLAWLDREWGSGALGIEQQGWDWFAIQLDDRSTLMFYALRNRDGTRDKNSAGTWLESDGSVRALSDQDVQIEALDFWASPRGGRYPSHWRVHVPALALNLDIRPALADQELDTSPRYWEGAVNVTGTRKDSRVAGRGYVELVGYARARSSP